MPITNSKAIFYTLACIMLFLAASLKATSQQDTSIIWNIVTVDGNEFNGKILSRNIKEVKLKTESLGIITIQVSHIHTIASVDPNRIHNGEVWLQNPQETRYFWQPSSYGLKKGEGYYQNAWIMFNQVAIGVTDNFSIGAGVVPLFLFGGGATPLWMTPKFSFPIEEDAFNIGGGALIGTVLGDDIGPFGIAYGTTTFGGREKNITLGLGYGFADGGWAKSPTITISGMFRTGKKGYLLTENYLISTGESTVGFLSLGGKIVWRKISLDYGGFVPIVNDFGGFGLIPWLGIVIPFGHKEGF